MSDLPPCKHRMPCPYNGIDSRTGKEKEGHPGCEGNCEHPQREGMLGYKPVCRSSIIYTHCPEKKKLII